MIVTRSEAKRPASWSPAAGYLTISIIPAAFLLIFFVIPLGTVVLTGFTVPNVGIGNYAKAIHNEAFVKVFIYTLEISLIVTVICLFIAFPAASLLARATGRVLAIGLVMILVPCWISTVIRTYSWMLILQKNGALNGALKAFGLIDVPLSFLNSTTGVLIGMIHILLPYMLLPLISNLRQMDRNLINASSVLGAGPVQSFVFVYLPLSVPAIVAGCTLVFVTALGFFITPSLLGGAKNTMIAVLISQQVTVLGDWGMASTLATILLATTLVIYGAFSALMRNPTGSQ